MWVAVLVVCVALASRLGAQVWPVTSDTAPRDTARTSTDSLVARLERAEAALELMRRQLATEAASGVRTRSRLQVELSARVLVNGYMSRGALNSSDVPTFATNDPPAAQGLPMAVTRTTGF